MNRAIAPLFSGCLLALAIAAPAHAEDAALRADLEKQYQQLAQAMEHKDVTALEALVTPDFSATDATGFTRHYYQAIGSWKQRLAPPEAIACRCQIESVESRGAEAVLGGAGEASSEPTSVSLMWLSSACGIPTSARSVPSSRLSE
jgi:hypothetical protein